MGPLEAKIRYVIEVRVTRIFQLEGYWYVHFDGSRESLCLGTEKPDFEVNQMAKITMERLDYAIPSPAPVE